MADNTSKEKEPGVYFWVGFAVIAAAFLIVVLGSFYNFLAFKDVLKFTFVSMFGKGENTAPSFFTILLSTGTFAGVIMAAIFYRKQAIAQQEQADEMVKQSTAAIENSATNQRLFIFNSFEEAVRNLNSSNDYSVRASAIHTIFEITDNYFEAYQRKTIQVYSNALAEYSLSIQSTAVRKEQKKKEIYSFNQTVININMIVKNLAELTSRTSTIYGMKNAVVLASIINVTFPVARSLTSELEINKEIIYNYIFDDIEFYECDFKGVIFYNCSFNYTRFIRCRNFTFENCFFSFRNDIENDFSKNLFINCTIFQEHLSTSLWYENEKTQELTKHVNSTNFTIFEEKRFSEWLMLNKIERMANWDKLYKKHT